MTGTVLDISARQPDPPPPTVRIREGRRIVVPKAQIIRGKAVRRDLRDITAVVLHQTACYFGAKDATARHDRALNVHAHMTCFRDGTAVLAYPREFNVYASHDFCSYSVAQEHEGHFDEDGNPYDVDKSGKHIAPPADYSLEAVIEAGRAGIASHLEACPNLRDVLIHRQTTNKPACPGKVIFREVGLWSVKKHGLRIQPDLTRRDGTKVPAPWYAKEWAYE